MKFKLQYYILFLFYLVLFSCNNHKDKEIKSEDINEYDYKLSWLKTMKFELDSMTLPYSESFQIIGIEDDLYMTFLNYETQTIYYYDYKKGIFDHVCDLKKSQLAEAYEFDGHYFHTPDSILLLDYESAKMFIANSNGEIITTFSLKRDFALAKHPPTPVLGTYNPIKIFNNKLLASGYVGGEYQDELNNRPVLIVYDFSTEVINYHLNYPEKYLNMNWGGWFYRQIFCSYDKNRLLISFPASNEIYYVEDINNMNINKNLPYDLLNIKPMAKNKNIERTKRKINKHFLDNYYYGPIITDIYNNIYYRVKYLPKKKYDLSNWRTYERLYSIEIYNKKLEKCGEHFFSKESFLNNAIFVTPDGLNIRFIDRNEDLLTFNIYKLEQI
jgi:hypothetical protein